jgi:hypothetical protein
MQNPISSRSIKEDTRDWNEAAEMEIKRIEWKRKLKRKIRVAIISLKFFLHMKNKHIK